MILTYLSSGPRERVFDALLAAGHRITRVCVTDPERWPKVGPTIERARSRGIPVSVVGRNDLATLGKELRGETCLSVGFAYILPPSFLSAVKVCLNVHGTLLPNYAGGRTLNWVIACGESQSGVTVHAMEEGVDSGPILLQKSFPLSPFDTSASLYRKTLEFEPAVVVEALEIYERQGLSGAVPQNSSGVIRYPDRLPEHSRLDPSRPLAELYDAIRAADPDRYPAFFEVAGQKVCIRLWRPDRPKDEEDML